MKNIIYLLIFFIFLKLDSVEFVLFTQPKTATHLLIPILTDLTNKNVYWAKEYTTNAEPLNESFEKASKNSENLLFSLVGTPWNREMMDLVWSTNKRNNTFLHLHAPYSATMENYLLEKKCINFFVKRDPRDQIVSLLNHYKYISSKNKEALEDMATDDQRLLYIIKKESKIQTVHYMNWLHSPICCILNFDKLMGDHGGAATQADALEEMRKIASALQLNLSDQVLINIYKKHFGKGWSFFKGKVGSWKNYFNEGHKTLIKEELGDLLIQLGYEKNLDW